MPDGVKAAENNRLSRAKKLKGDYRKNPTAAASLMPTIPEQDLSQKPTSAPESAPATKAAQATNPFNSLWDGLEASPIKSSEKNPFKVPDSEPEPEPEPNFKTDTDTLKGPTASFEAKYEELQVQYDELQAACVALRTQNAELRALVTKRKVPKEPWPEPEPAPTAQAESAASAPEPQEELVDDELYSWEATDTIELSIDERTDLFQKVSKKPLQDYSDQELIIHQKHLNRLFGFPLENGDKGTERKYRNLDPEQEKQFNEFETKARMILKEINEIQQKRQTNLEPAPTAQAESAAPEPEPAPASHLEKFFEPEPEPAPAPEPETEANELVKRLYFNADSTKLWAIDNVFLSVGAHAEYLEYDDSGQDSLTRYSNVMSQKQLEQMRDKIEQVIAPCLPILDRLDEATKCSIFKLYASLDTIDENLKAKREASKAEKTTLEEVKNTTLQKLAAYRGSTKLEPEMKDELMKLQEDIKAVGGLPLGLLIQLKDSAKKLLNKFALREETELKELIDMLVAMAEQDLPPIAIKPVFYINNKQENMCVSLTIGLKPAPDDDQLTIEQNKLTRLATELKKKLQGQSTTLKNIGGNLKTQQEVNTEISRLFEETVKRKIQEIVLRQPADLKEVVEVNAVVSIRAGRLEVDTLYNDQIAIKGLKINSRTAQTIDYSLHEFPYLVKKETEEDYHRLTQPLQKKDELLPIFTGDQKKCDRMISITKQMKALGS